MVLCAVFGFIVHDIYGIQGEGTLTLTGTIEAGMPVPAVPKFSVEMFDDKTNTTITRKNFIEIASVGKCALLLADRSCPSLLPKTSFSHKSFLKDLELSSLH